MFQPDYKNIVDAAKNIKPQRIPLYEHSISYDIIEEMTGKKFIHLYHEGASGKKEFFKNYCDFFKNMGYDAISYEEGVGPIMPGSGALGGHKEGVIKTREDFLKYPWEEISDLYFKSYSEHFDLLREVMPDGMKAIGGVGNGVFECVQDIVGYTELCYIRMDDMELYADLFSRVGKMLYEIWEKFLKTYGDIYCVCRFGDDLGFKSDTLICHDDIKKYIVPQYKNVVDLVHKHGKPFLLHSCGAIFDVMDEMISVAKIDAKHSNEDAIAPFSDWIDRYGDKIGNFGGIDTDAICGVNDINLEEYVTEIYNVMLRKNGGAAIGSGNSIPNYVSAEKYALMNKTIRSLRGDF